jgi:flagellar motor protein MotB
MKKFFSRNRSSNYGEEKGYLESIGDLMANLLFTLLLIIFLFLFTSFFTNPETKLNQEILELKKDKQQLVQTVQQKDQEIQYEQSKSKAAKKTADDAKQTVEDAKKVRTHLLKQIQTSLRTVYDINVEIDPIIGSLRLPESILFDSGRANLKENGKRSLEALATVFAYYLPCYSGPKNVYPPGHCECFSPGRIDVVLVEGHTDNVPINTRSFSDNWDLSSERSRVTYLYLKEQSEYIEYLKNADGQPLLGISGYGETRPVDSNETEEQRMRNRRIDLRFVLAMPDLDQITVLGDKPACIDDK